MFWRKKKCIMRTKMKRYTLEEATPRSIIAIKVSENCITAKGEAMRNVT